MSDEQHNSTQDQQPDFESLSNGVFRMCVALLGNATDARDAAQEAMARAWSRRDARRVTVRWSTWCGGFAVRVCREFSRRNRRDAGLDLMDGILEMPESKTDESKSVDSGVLHRAIMTLPQRQREVTMLRFLAGYSVSETAETLGCPEGTVKSNLHKALERLRRNVSLKASIDVL